MVVSPRPIGRLSRQTRELTVPDPRSAFWDDLAEDLRDEEFSAEYARQSHRIASIDRIVSELDSVRAAAGMSKAELARAIGVEPASIRRLLTAREVNPTLATLCDVAAALGLQLSLTPLHTGRRAS